MSLAPLLLAVYPVLVEYTRNLDLLPPDALVRPLLVVLFGAGLLTLGLRVAVGNRERAGLYGAALVALFWWFRLLLRGMEALGVPGGLAVALSPALLVLLLGLARRRVLDLDPGRLGELHRCLLVFLWALFLMASFGLGRGLWNRSSPSLSTPEEVLAGLPRAAGRPSIYFVVLDAYVRDDFLKVRFGFDNEPFLRELEARGFYIAREARSNFAWTLLSVTSTLNMSFLDRPGPPTPLALVGHARAPLVERFLADQGYRTRSVASGDWAFDRTEFQESRGSFLQEFERMLFGLSLLGELFPQLPDVISRQQLDANLEAISPDPVGAEPGFHFIHIMAPHPPFVRMADGSSGDSLPFFGFHDVGGLAADMVMGEGWYRRRYLEQLQYLNRRLLERIDAVLAADPEAIFLMGGDHGSRSYTDAKGPEDQLREVHSILSAYRFPPQARRHLYPSISPVNGFRVLFDSLFGSHLGPLPDASFTTPRNQPARRQKIPDFGRLTSPENSPAGHPGSEFPRK